MDLSSLTVQRPVVVIGAAFGDVMLGIDTLPHSGEDVSAVPLGQQIGGCAFNVARALSRLGIHPVNGIPVGNGSWGAKIAALMTQENLPVLLHHPTHDNGWCLALVEASKERTFITIEGCEQHWSAALLAQIPVADNALIYVSGYELVSQNTAPLRDWLLAQSDDKTLFVDFGPRLRDIDGDFIEKLLAKKPLLTVNRDELTQLNPQGGRQSVTQITDAQAFADSYQLSLIARFDKDGATVCKPGQMPVTIPAYSVTVADAIAAGDSHSAGVLAGLACGLSLTDATQTGNAVAAMVISRPGADGAPTCSELSDFLQNH